MIYYFTAPVFTEGNRSFIEIPFNVWEETGLKGNVPCKITADGLSFECKLLPKGNGKYLIPVSKQTLAALTQKEEYDIGLEPIAALSRINHDSPYSKENPVRKIDGVTPIPMQSGFCGHLCVAMLASVTLSDVIALIGKGHASWSKILEALDYYGISYAQKAVYTRGKPYTLPPCCIINNDNGFVLWYKNSYCNVADIDPTKTVCYIEIFTE